MASTISPPRQPRTRTGRRESLHQVVNLQRFTFEVAQLLNQDAKSATDPETRARCGMAVASLGKSWCGLQDSKRETKGVPKVKAIDAIPRGTRRPAPHAPPVFDPQDEPAPAPLPTAHKAA